MSLSILVALVGEVEGALFKIFDHLEPGRKSAEQIMKILMSTGTAVAMSMALATQVLAEGSPKEGAELAKKWCTRCHDVAPNGAFKMQPPSFAAIAVYRCKDQIYGRIAFPNIHSGMPRMAFMLTPEGIENLVAYIVSLENTKQ
jgi:mono/diheme cytochrome c family protein